ncbi:MAG: glycoside hydrolase family 3 protein [Lachnospiraceae bacterium]|nr:glycoside hydrolase family 3 protein [Lachnospiraceae bacterium]
MNKWARALYQPNLPLYEGQPRVTASAEHIRLSKEAAREGMVLLKNENGLLPLPGGARIALFGKGTIDYVKGGGGSGDVTVPYIRNLAEGFAQLAQVSVFPDTVAYYEKEVRAQYEAGAVPGLVREPELPDALLQKAAACADIAVISISRFSGESWDRKSILDKIPKHSGVDQNLLDLQDAVFDHGDFYLTDAERAMVEKVCSAFAKVAVVLNVGGMVDTSWFAHDDRFSSVLLAWQGGIEGGLAAAELLCGVANPSGKLSDTFAKRLEDYPSSEGFFESDNYVEYTEDIYVGYRYFETIPGAAEKVVYPFGYGLSYTDFAIEDRKVSVSNDIVTVTALVKNIGSCAGKEVVQVYYSAPQGLLGKPARELAGYRKTALLRPGQSQEVRISFPVSQMASYDDLGRICKSAWVLEKGSYRFFIGTDVRSAEESPFVHVLPENIITEQLQQRMAPTQLTKRLRADGSYEELPTGTPNEIDASVLPDHVFDATAHCRPAVRPVPRMLAWGPKQEGHYDLIDVAEGRVSLDDFISQLSDEDLAYLLSGQPNTGAANTFGYGNNPQFGIPNVMTADGPAGLRILPHVGVATTAFPCSTLLACTFDPDVVYAVGRAGAEEVKENNICAWLTPAVNIHRSPLCGRNFEYYSEDPLLAGRQASAMVRGIQSMHIAATPKHFALNNKETNRRDSDSRASERAIREIYLKAFEIIVKEADPWSLMTSYNIINAHRSSENADLLNGILRGEWGYEGLVMTDWWNRAEHYKEVLAGNDVKMGCGYPERILDAMEKGAVTREDLVRAARHVLGMILKLD